MFKLIVQLKIFFKESCHLFTIFIKMAKRETLQHGNRSEDYKETKVCSCKFFLKRVTTCFENLIGKIVAVKELFQMGSKLKRLYSLTVGNSFEKYFLTSVSQSF